RHTRSKRDWSSDVCSSDLKEELRVERTDNGQGITIALSKALNKAKNDDKIIDELVYYIDESLTRMGEEKIDAETAAICPVVRARSEERRVGKRGRCQSAAT